MQSFTMASEEMSEALDEAIKATSESYPMTLNPSDLRTLVRVLGSHGGFYELTEDEADWATSFYGDIAMHYGIEGI